MWEGNVGGNDGFSRAGWVFFFQGECGRGLSRFVVQGIRFSYTGLELMVILLFYIPRISVYGRVFSIEIL